MDYKKAAAYCTGNGEDSRQQHSLPVYFIFHRGQQFHFLKSCTPANKNVHRALPIISNGRVSLCGEICQIICRREQPEISSSRTSRAAVVTITNRSPSLNRSQISA